MKFTPIRGFLAKKYIEGFKKEFKKNSAVPVWPMRHNGIPVVIVSQEDWEKINQNLEKYRNSFETITGYFSITAEEAAKVGERFRKKLIKLIERKKKVQNLKCTCPPIYAKEDAVLCEFCPIHGSKI